MKTVVVCISLIGLLFSLPVVLIKLADWALWDGHLGEYQKVGWNAWYALMLRLAPVEHFALMNWGLAPPTHACATTAAEPLQANLYLQLAALQGIVRTDRVLEVGSGRGGGAAVLSKCMCPSEYVGVDLNAAQVAAAQAQLSSAEPCPLRFAEGDAENLPFADGHFDVVVNVESSHTYPHFPRFVNEVRRVLRPNGTFLVADFREVDPMVQMRAELEAIFGPPFKVEDISMRVASALQQDLAPDGPRQKLAKALCPSFLFSACLKFIGASALETLGAGSKLYMMFAHRKQ